MSFADDDAREAGLMAILNNVKPLLMAMGVDEARALLFTHAAYQECLSLVDSVYGMPGPRAPDPGVPK